MSEAHRWAPSVWLVRAACSRPERLTSVFSKSFFCTLFLRPKKRVSPAGAKTGDFDLCFLKKKSRPRGRGPERRLPFWPEPQKGSKNGSIICRFYACISCRHTPASDNAPDDKLRLSNGQNRKSSALRRFNEVDTGIDQQTPEYSIPGFVGLKQLRAAPAAPDDTVQYRRWLPAACSVLRKT